MESAEHVARIRDHYLPLLKQHDRSHLVVDWAIEEQQHLRFSILADIGNIREASVLDIGCGVGHFAGWLLERDFAGTYTGIDVLPEMVERAQQTYPELRFETANFLDDPTRWQADLIIASGIFHLSDMALMKETISAMFEICGRGVAFNSLSAWSPVKYPDNFLFVDPIETLEYCKGLTRMLLLRHEYLRQDFTIYLYRT
jgi:SAM-dependent methyltransferase